MFKNLLSSIKSLFESKTQRDVNVPPSEIKTTQASPAARKEIQRQKPPGTHRRSTEQKKDRPRPHEARGEKHRQPKPVSAPVVQEAPWDRSVFSVPVVEGETRFQDFNIPDAVMHAIHDLNFQYCTPVQSLTLAMALAGNDVTAQAQTGTGKTAAFLITIFNHFITKPLKGERQRGTPRALILAPTRELAMQIERDARLLGKYVSCGIIALFGGIDYVKQQKQLQHDACDVLICTPGRLIDFKKKKLVDLSKVEILVLDEADRMLDMGFILAVKSIVLSTPPKAQRQTMFFSATMSSDVKRLAESWTRQAHDVNVKPEEVAVDSVDQITYITTRAEKQALLYNLIMQKQLERVLMFTNRRDEAKRLQQNLEAYGISSALLSGDVDQKQRISRLERFREGKIRVLVATDVASRGIHVEGISHVINYNLPLDVEEYVHRIGRTGRAGASGTSINFADEEDSHELPKLEEFLGKKVICVYPDEHLLTPIPEIHARRTTPERERRAYNPRPHSPHRSRRR